MYSFSIICKKLLRTYVFGAHWSELVSLLAEEYNSCLIIFYMSSFPLDFKMKLTELVPTTWSNTLSFSIKPYTYKFLE